MVSIQGYHRLIKHLITDDFVLIWRFILQVYPTHLTNVTSNFVLSLMEFKQQSCQGRLHKCLLCDMHDY